jgi:hypothetical protein
MKAYYLLAPLSVALFAGCAYEPTYHSPPVAYVTPAPTYVAPPSTVIMGAGPAWNQIDSDNDGYANSVDRHPYDSRWH